MNIVIANRQRMQKINSLLLKEITASLMADLKIEEAELGISLVAEREMTLVNETFLQHEGSTDVITFDYSDAESKVLGARLKLRGEIFVCVDEAVSQANKFKTIMAVGNRPLRRPRRFASAGSRRCERKGQTQNEIGRRPAVAQTFRSLCLEQTVKRL